LDIELRGIIRPLACFSIGQGPSRYLGSKKARWQRYNYNFTFNWLPWPKKVKILEDSGILNLEMAGKQVFELSVFLLSSSQDLQ
jgi:hypothetical protein